MGEPEACPEIAVANCTQRLAGASRSPDFVHRPLQPHNELPQAQTKCLAESTEFEHVNAPLTSLTLADEGLCLSDFVCKLSLSEASILAYLFQDLQEDSIAG